LWADMRWVRTCALEALPVSRQVAKVSYAARHARELGIATKPARIQYIRIEHRMATNKPVNQKRGIKEPYLRMNSITSTLIHPGRSRRTGVSLATNEFDE
jgi:hypothetical protein